MLQSIRLSRREQHAGFVLFLIVCLGYAYELSNFNLSPSDVNSAIRAQNALVPAGAIGDLPNLSSQTMSATVVVKGQLENVEQFGAIVLRANADGSTVSPDASGDAWQYPTQSPEDTGAPEASATPTPAPTVIQPLPEDDWAN